MEATPLRAAFTPGIRTFGDARNPPVLFLHGIRLGGAIWYEHARMLQDDFFVIAPDLPGHAALAELPFEIPVCDAFLSYVVEHVARRPPLVVGYSLGGYLAMQFANDAPERTAGLLLTGCTTDVVGRRRTLYEIAVAVSAQFPAAFIEKVLAVFFRLTLPERLASTIVPFRFNPRVLQASRKVTAGVRYSELLSAYRKPVLIVNGEWDLLFRQDEQKYAEALRADVVVMAGTDHVAPLRRPGEFVRALRRFAQQVFTEGSVGTPL